MAIWFFCKCEFTYLVEFNNYELSMLKELATIICKSILF